MEGFALADLIVSRGLNTSVRAGCASACVLAFAAGKERLATRSSRFGLHRSGVTWRRNGGALSPTDLAMKDFFTSRGIAADFIARALEQPLEKIWEPSFSEILGSQLATGEWLPLPQ